MDILLGRPLCPHFRNSPVRLVLAADGRLAKRPCPALTGTEFIMVGAIKRHSDPLRYACRRHVARHDEADQPLQSQSIPCIFNDACGGLRREAFAPAAFVDQKRQFNFRLSVDPQIGLWATIEKSTGMRPWQHSTASEKQVGKRGGRNQSNFRSSISRPLMAETAPSSCARTAWQCRTRRYRLRRRL